MQAMDSSIPFGGVNGSGTGAYNGIYGFRELSHQKGIFYDNDTEANKFFYPPFEGKLDHVKEAGLSLFDIPHN